jgi:peptidoglycan/LPS O-acetylase OafA/YrhL
MTGAASYSAHGESDRIDALQGLRAVAALSVLLAHAIGDIRQLPNGIALLPMSHLGAAGVDLFFVISGFVMVYAGRSVAEQPCGWAQFLARRIARVAPMYWLAMLLYALMQAGRGKWHVFQPDRILTSAAFWPYRAQDGTMLPFYGIGWTLNFEMFFYGVFGIGLWALRGRAPPFIAAALCMFVLAGALLPLGNPLAYWSDSIILEFVFGMGIAAAYLAGLRLSAGVSFLLGGLGIGLIVAGGLSGYVAPLPSEPFNWPRCIVWGVPVALVMAAVILRPAGRLASWAPLQALGDASYSIYLLHSLTIILSRPVIAAALDLTPSAAGKYWIAAAAVALVSAVTCALSLMTFRLFEKPINDGVRVALKARRERQPATG